MNEITLRGLYICLFWSVPWPFLAWAWLRWRAPARTVGRARKAVTITSFVALLGSATSLVVFPVAIQYLWGGQLPSWDPVYIHSIWLGLLATLCGSALAPFAVPRMKIPLVIAGMSLLGLWTAAATSL